MPNDNPYYNPPAQTEPTISRGSYTPSAPAAAKGPSLWEVLKAKMTPNVHPLGQDDMIAAQQRRAAEGR